MDAAKLLRIDLLSLRLFEDIITHGSMARAAEARHIAPSAVSRRMSDLELACGARLLTRHPRGMRPTHAGRTVARFAASILEQADHMASELSDQASGVEGHIRISATISAITQFLSDDISVFLRTHPKVRIDLREEVSRKVVDLVLSGRADLGVAADLGPHPASGRLNVREYRTDELTVIAPKGHPLHARSSCTFKETLAYDHIVMQAESSLHQLLNGKAVELGGAFREKLSAASFDSVRRLAAAGVGISILPRGSVAGFAQAEGFSLIPLSDLWARRRLMMVARDFDALTAAAKAFVEIAQHNIPQSS
ncbi:MAG: LysR family transcriptional regulator [Alphaproteobacteria bacterium]|nr:LysR family transcriptional regulator [Alphaproteobacteria bacterium]